MDDLFRQASDQYPLRTDSSDWEKLAIALEANPSLISPPVIEQGDKRRRKRFLWLLLLLPLGGLGYYAMQRNIHARPGVDMANAKANVDAKEVNIKTGADTRADGNETRTEIGAEKTGEAVKSVTGERAKPVMGERQRVKSVMGESAAAGKGSTSIVDAGTGVDAGERVARTGQAPQQIRQGSRQGIMMQIWSQSQAPVGII